MSQVDYEKYYKISKQSLNRACDYLEERIGCPKQNRLFTCDISINECRENDETYGEVCWIRYFSKLAKEDIEYDDNLLK